MSTSHASIAELKQQVFARKTATKRSKGMPKSTVIAGYAGIFLLVISLVAMGYRPPQPQAEVANVAPAAAVSQTPASNDQPSVDQLVATTIAANVAETTNLPVAANLAERTSSLSIRSELAQSDNAVITKQVLVQPTSDKRDMTTYVAVTGDNATSIGEKFNVSAQTIRWANNLPADAVEPGKSLTIPPTDGVMYTVKDGDTVDAIADKYKADKSRVVSFNDLELGGLSKDKKIFLPGGVLPETERPGYVEPRQAASQGASSGGFSTVNAQIAAASVGNKYVGGYCTWYVYERRAQLGRVIGSFWGNATTWAAAASAAGVRVDKVPEVGSIAQWNAYQGGSGFAGHVAVVESINADGSLTLSEMNYNGNFNRITSRTIPASMVNNFIH